MSSVHENEELFRALVEDAFDLISILDADGTVRYRTPAVERSLGYVKGEFLGESVFTRVHPEDQALVRDAFQRLLEHPESTLTLEFRFQHRDGSWPAFRATGRNLLDHSVVRGIVIHAQDVSESRRLEVQLHHAQRMEALGRLTGGVAHDFNNVLAIIKGSVQMMQLDTKAEDPRKLDLEIIDEAVNRASSLTQQLLAFSRKQVLEPRVMDLNERVHETDKMLRRLLGSDVELATVLDPDLGPIQADESQIEQILLNLAVNARDAMPSGGRLVIETRNVEMSEDVEHLYPHLPAGSPAVLLSVSDTGHGMDARTLEMIFEPFFTTKPPGKGTGLGLSTVYGIVKQSGGYIWAESEVGEGTTFKIYLPRGDGALDSRRSQESEVVLERTGSGTVLVVEDEAQLREVVRKMLSHGGYTVLEASNGEEALRLCKERGEGIDVLVTDMVMPLMNGQELIEEVARLCPGLPVLCMSGYSDEAAWPIERLPPGIMLLQKPFPAEQLLGSIARLLHEAHRSG